MISAFFYEEAKFNASSGKSFMWDWKCDIHESIR